MCSNTHTSMNTSVTELKNFKDEKECKDKILTIMIISFHKIYIKHKSSELFQYTNNQRSEMIVDDESQNDIIKTM